MKRPSEGRVIHSYDTEQRRVRCGTTEQTSSTKHGREVTCVPCRDLLDRAGPALRAVPRVDPLAR